MTTLSLLLNLFLTAPVATQGVNPDAMEDAASETGSSIQQIHDYTITLKDGFNSLSVQACFDGVVPEVLYSGHSGAGRLVRGAHMIENDQRRQLKTSGGQLVLPGTPDDGCIHYRVDLGAAARSRSIDTAARTGDALVLSPKLWLWRPRQLNRFIDVRLHFQLDEDIQIQGPWQMDWALAQETGQPVYRLGYPPLGWDSDFLMGRFDRFQLASQGSRVTVAQSNGPGESADPAVTRHWLQSGLDAAESIYGRLPSNRGQVIIIPLDSGNRPMAQGRVSRAGGPSMSLGMNAHQAETDYQADGLIAHEFLHWLHPPIAADHRWLPEGLASYYQYIGLARAGYLSPETAWQRLLEDMDDGLWDRPHGGTLLDISRRMNQLGGAEYVYWASAALFLKADVALRQRSDNRQSLDHILALWADCCFERRRSLDGRNALDQLDELAGGEPLFRPLYDDHVLAVGFPDIEGLLRDLGLPALGDDFELDDDAPLAPIRQAIMRGHERPLYPIQADKSDNAEPQESDS